VKFRKKKHFLDTDLSVADINSRIRGFLLDSQLPHAHDLADASGLPAISPEVAEKEEEVSDERYAKISRMLPLLFAFTHVIVESTMDLQKKKVEGLNKLPPGVIDQTRKSLEQLVLASLTGALSQLVDMELVTVTRRLK
jgi:hypothetical protein